MSIISDIIPMVPFVVCVKGLKKQRNLTCMGRKPYEVQTNNGRNKIQVYVVTKQKMKVMLCYVSFKGLGDGERSLQ